MKARRPVFDNRVLVALHVAALIFSTSVAAAESSPNSAEWPRGNGWTFQAGPQEAAHAAHDWEVPDSLLLPDILTPKIKIVAPAEFKLNITLTIRRNGRPA